MVIAVRTIFVTLLKLLNVFSEAFFALLACKGLTKTLVTDPKSERRLFLPCQTFAGVDGSLAQDGTLRSQTTCDLLHVRHEIVEGCR